MKELLINPYSFDAYEIERDSQGRALVNLKIMTTGRLKYQDENGNTFYGNISLDELTKAAETANLKPITIKHPANMLKPSDVASHQEGVSGSGYSVKEIDGKPWLFGPAVLATERAIKTAEDGKLGVSSGYNRTAVPTGTNGEFDFVDIDINHIAIGCDNPRAEGAGISLDEAEDDSARIYSFAQAAKPKKKEVMMKQKLNAVKVGAFSLDEAPIEYDEEGTGTEQAIAKFQEREGKLVDHIEFVDLSMDEMEKTHKKDIGELSGANKVLTSKVEDLEKEKETMISMDNVDVLVKELAVIRELADFHKIDVKFNTPFEGQKAIVDKVYPDQSFDDAEIPGAFKTIASNKKDTAAVIKSKEALAAVKTTSMDERKVGLSAIPVSELRKKLKKA